MFAVFRNQIPKDYSLIISWKLTSRMHIAIQVETVKAPSAELDVEH